MESPRWRPMPLKWIYVSSHRLDSNAIPTAITMFSGSSIPRVQVSTLYNQVEETGSKSKMAVYNTGMLVYQLPDQIATRFQRFYLCFRSQPLQWDKYRHSTTTIEKTGSIHPKWRPLPLYCIYICPQAR